jgi:hypothetical protein
MSYTSIDSHLLENDMPEATQLDKQITGLLGRLQEPWHCNKADGGVEGYLYKRQRKAPHRWRLYKFVLSGNNLYYYTNDKSKKPRGIISVSYITPKLPTTEEQLLEIKNAEVSTTHIKVFSPNRLDLLCAMTNAEMDKWHAALDSVVKDNLRPDEIASRDKTLQELMPLLAQKTSHDIERILAMISELEQSGFASVRAKKEKTGNLDMLTEDAEGNNTWTKYYFVLQNQCLYYYKTSKAPPKGIITLKFTQIATETAPDMQNCFRLTTPLSQFVLRAKHAVAMEEWVTALANSKAGKKPVKSGEGERANLLGDDEFSDLSTMQELSIQDGSYGYHKKLIPQVVFIGLDGKPKVFKLQLGSNVIGRSDSSQVKVDDKKVSRSHCKIEVTENAAVLLDLGSGHGTKVNRARVDKQVIKPGDVIKVGKTKLKFDVVKK